MSVPVSTAPYLSIAWNGSVFVVVDTSSSMYKYSYDGISWSNASVPSLTTNKPYNAKWLGDKMVITGNLQSSAQENVIITSPDGINYSITKTENGVQLRDVETNLEYRNRITFPHSVNLALGGTAGESTTLRTKIAYSLDNGISWRKSTNASDVFSGKVNDAVWNGRIWVAVGEGTGNTIAISKNGETWQGCGINTIPTSGNCVRWSNELNIFVAGGNGINAGSICASSVDGIFWMKNSLTKMLPVNALEYNGNIWVIGGKPTDASNASLAYSLNGISWTSVPYMFTTDVSNIVWNDSYWTAYGRSGNYSQIATSNDGMNWTINNSDLVPSPFYNDTFFLQGGSNNTYLKSIDNATRITSSSVSDMSMSNITRFVKNTSTEAVASIQPITIACGEGKNTLAYSADGIFWTGLGSTVFTIRANKAVWNGTIWVAVGTGSNWVATSYDGLIWKGRDNTIMTEGYDVAYNGGRFIAVGRSDASNATIVRSNDGITWIPISNSVQIFSIRASKIAWTGRRWLAYGSGGNTTAISINNGISWSATTPKNIVVSDVSSVFEPAKYFTTGSASLSQNGYVISSSMEFNNSNRIANMFDNSNNTYANTTTVANMFNNVSGVYTGTINTAYTLNDATLNVSGEWVQLTLPSPVIIKYFKLSLPIVLNQNTHPMGIMLLGLSTTTSVWQQIYVYTDTNLNSYPNNTNSTFFTHWFNLNNNTSSYTSYRVVFTIAYQNSAINTYGLRITSIDFYTENANTNILSIYQSPIVLKYVVVLTNTEIYNLITAFLVSASSYAIRNELILTTVSTYAPTAFTSNTTSVCFDGERFFFTNISGNVTYMTNVSSNTNLDIDGVPINSRLTRIYGSCWNQQFVLFCGGTGANTGGITYGRLDASTNWFPTNASELFSSVYGVSSNPGYGYTYIPNAVYLNTNEILRVVGPKAYTTPGETAIKFNLLNANII
jgi:hypothetical protein